MILVDSDILIDLSRGFQETAQYLSALENQGALAISVVTKMEMIRGCRNRSELDATLQLLKRFIVVPISEADSLLAASLLEDYSLSHGLQIPDALIAATVLTKNAEFLTRNTRHFEHIDRIRLVRL